MPWQRSVRLWALKDALESLNTKEHIKKDPIKYFVEKFFHFCTYFASNTDETAFSLTPFIFDFSNYSRSSLYRVPFSFLVLIDFYMFIQSEAISCLAFLSLQSRSYWNCLEVQFNAVHVLKYMGIEVLQITVISVC